MELSDYPKRTASYEEILKNPMKHRSLSRLAAVQALFQIEMTQTTPEKAVTEFYMYRFKEMEEVEGFIKADLDFFSNLVIGTGEAFEDIDPLIINVLADGWRLERIEPVVRAILRAGVYELSQFQKTPARVIVSEYVDITHAFYEDKEAAFVNGALDRIARSLRSEEF